MDPRTENALRLFNEQMGGFGRFQKFTFFLTCLIFVMCGISALNYVFTAFEVSYRCSIPSCENPLNSSYEEDFINFTTPFEDNSTKISPCYTYALTNENVNDSCNKDDFNSSRTVECSQWIYDKSLFTSTLVSDFNLTCKRSWLQSLASSAYMFGMPFGALFLGDLGDRIGRKKGIMIALILAVISEFLATFSINYYMYFATRFFSGAGSVAAYQIALIQALEVVHHDKRAFCGMMMKIPFSIAQASVAIFAYFIRSWRWLQLTLSLPFFLLFSYWWIMTESIRWLLSKGRYEEARAAIKRAADMNKVEISSDVYNDLFTNEKDGETGEPSEASKRSSFDLFKTPRLRKKTLILIILWIISIHAQYNSAVNTAYFGGTIFTSYFFVILIDIPSYLFTYFLLNKWGRKGTLVFFLFVGGLAGISSTFYREDMIMGFIALNLVGRFSASAAVSTIYIFTIEIYSTQYRSLGLGLCSMSSRAGGVLAPFSARLAIVYKPLPLIITGISCFIGGFLALLLPETLGQELPQTLEESENYGADQKLLYFACCSKKEEKVETKSNLH